MRENLERTQTTYRLELLRAVSAGVLETAGSTFLLLITVRYFSAGAFAKAAVAGGGSLGLLLSPAVVSLVSSIKWPTTTAAARLLWLGAICFCVAFVVPGLLAFVICSALGMATSTAIIPLLTQMYQDNYPEKERGRRFSRTVMVRIAFAAAFSKVAGEVLDGHIERYRWLVLVFGGAIGFAGFLLSRCPGRSLSQEGGAHPFRAMRFLREDPLFRRTLICWMLMGFANLMMLPLRVEYLANPKYHFSTGAISIGMIALLTGVIPNLARLALSPVWGYLFDHMNFFTVRVTLNVGFAIGIVTFFTTGSTFGLICGSIVYGISNAGGDVAWSLWVTKFASPDRVADYMAVHTFFTGVRGVAAPLIAFVSANHFSPSALATFCAGLILVSTLLLFPEIKTGRRGGPLATFVEEASE